MCLVKKREEKVAPQQCRGKIEIQQSAERTSLQVLQVYKLTSDFPKITIERNLCNQQLRDMLYIYTVS